MDLCKFLSSNDTDESQSKKAALFFIQCLELKNKDVTGNFMELLFHAGGWLTYKYSASEFPPVEQFALLEERYLVNLHPLITQPKFQQSLSTFLSHLFEVNESSLVYDEEFIKKTLLVFHPMMSGSWNPFKLVAFIFGMQLMHCVDRECDRWLIYENTDNKDACPGQTSNGSPNAPNVHKKLEYLSGITGHIFVKIYPKVVSCPFSTPERCYTNSLRNLNDVTTPCPFHLSLIRACNMQSIAIMDEKWLPIVLNGLRSQKLDIQGIALMIIFQTLNDMNNLSFKQRVFKLVKSDLLHLLSSRSELSEFCLRILNNCFGFFNVGDRLSFSDMETILYFLYDNSQTLAALAGEIVCWSRFVPNSLNADPVELIVHLVEINHESFIKCEELIIDSTFHLIKTFLKWADWVKVIKNAPADDIPSFMRMLCAYIQKATSDFTPKVRKCKVFQQLMDVRELTSNKSIYTSLVSDYWFELLELQKISNNSKAVACLLKMIQFFDASILESAEKVENYTYVCLAYFTIAKDVDVIEEACSSLAALKKLSNTDHPIVEKVIKAAILTCVEEFSQIHGGEENVILKQKRIVSVTKHFEVDDNQLWWKCCDKLRSAPSLEIDAKLKVRQIGVLMHVLFQLMMKKVSSTAEQLPSKYKKPEPNAVLKDCMSRAVALKTHLKTIMRSQQDPQLRRMAFVNLLGFMEYVTSHWWSQVSLDEEEVTILVNYAVNYMEFENCLATTKRTALANHCCSIIRMTSSLISNGYIDIHCITPFLRCIGKSSLHDDLLMDALNKYAAEFPNRKEKLATAIFNTYMLAVKNVMALLMDERVQKYTISKLKVFLREFTNFLVTGNKFMDKSIMRIVSVRVHTFIIELALRPSGLRVLIDILVDVSSLLSSDDIDSVLSVFRQYKTDNRTDVTNYEKFLKWLNS